MENLETSVSEWNRRAALEEIELLKVVRTTAWDEHTHTYRWLMASLLGVNGAACLGMLSQPTISISHKIVAGGLFVAGILAALLVAVFGQFSVQRSLAPLQKLVGYWMTVASDGARDESLEVILNDELKSSAKIGLGSRFTGWLSAVLFLAGAVVAGVGMQKHEQSQLLAKLQHQTAQPAK